MEKFRSIVCRLLSAALNLALVAVEPRAFRISWELAGMQLFTYYTENSNLFATVVCLLVAVYQIAGIFTGRPLPLWLKRLKFIASTCLAMTFFTVVFVLAPYYGDGWLYTLLFTSSMLYHHFLNPVLAVASFVLFEREPRLPGRSVPLALVPSILYGVVAVWANAVRLLDGPYPFLQIYNQTPRETLFWLAAVMGSNLFYAWLVWRLGGNKARRVPVRD